MMSQAEPLQDLTEGNPSTFGPVGETAHIAIQAKRPAHARLLWVNFNALEDANIDLPENGMTPDFEHVVAGEVHWVVPDSENAEDYLSEETRTFHSTLYGGTGMTGFGDGRAFARKKIQIKYSGKTKFSAVSPRKDFTHSYGRGPLSRGFSEAIWGETNQDFPYSSNRTLTVSDRGTWTRWPKTTPDGPETLPEREGLISRENPLRPAHYAKRIQLDPKSYFADDMIDELLSADETRLQDALPRLADALPKPIGFNLASSTSEKLHAGLNEVVDRIAEQKAFELANGFFFGADSTSNIELNGKLLDFDTMTAQPHFMRLETKSGVNYGDMEMVKNEIIDPLTASVYSHIASADRKGVPTRLEFRKRFDEQYAFRLRRNFVELTGIPRETVSALVETTQGKRLVDVLGKNLYELALDGSKRVQFNDDLPKEAPTFDLHRILVNLAAEDPLSTENLANSVSREMQSKDSKTLVEAYHAVMTEALALVKQKGLDEVAFHHYVFENAKLRNAEIADVYRPALRKENERLVDEYLRTQNRDVVWKSIDERVRRSRRVYRDSAAYELVLDQVRDPFHHVITRQIFNAKTGEYEVIVRSKIKNGSAYFFGNRLQIAELQKATLFHSGDHFKQGVKASLNSEFVEFRIPFKHKPSSIELALSSGDGSHWWKAGEQNVKIAFIERSSIPPHPHSPHPRDSIPSLKALEKRLDEHQVEKEVGFFAKKKCSVLSSIRRIFSF